MKTNFETDLQGNVYRQFALDAPEVRVLNFGGYGLNFLAYFTMTMTMYFI